MRLKEPLFLVIAELGGLLGLFLGYSLLSLMEVLFLILWLLLLVYDRLVRLCMRKNRVSTKVVGATTPNVIKVR
jgi:hypothetical protein